MQAMKEVCGLEQNMKGLRKYAHSCKSQTIITFRSSLVNPSPGVPLKTLKDQTLDALFNR
jgi:hypothetical protein